MMTIRNMQDMVIRVYGFEHPATIYFFEECARTDDIAILEIAFQFAMGWIENDEDAE